MENVFSQTTMVSKEIRELQPRKDLMLELQELVAKVEKCDYYNSALIWNIGVSQIEEGCLLNISMQETLNIDYEICRVVLFE